MNETSVEASAQTEMTIEQRRDRARNWLKTIRSDVQDLLIDDYIFWEVEGLRKQNAALSAPHQFFHWMMAAHVESATIGVRRHVKISKQSISLAGFLEELARYPDLISRNHHVSVCLAHGGEVREEFPHASFDQAVGKGAERIDAAVVQEEIKEFKKLGLRLETLADKRFAHYDRKGFIGERPTFNDLQDCLSFMEKITLRYMMLIEGVFERTLLPPLPPEWKNLFRHPWLT